MGGFNVPAKNRKKSNTGIKIVIIILALIAVFVILAQIRRAKNSVLEVVKLIINKLTEWIDKANDYLQWIDRSISLPDWMNTTMNIMAVICILIGTALFFSKKKVIEISFTDKRICVPEKSMTKQEYSALYQIIVNARKMLQSVNLL